MFNNILKVKSKVKFDPDIDPVIDSEMIAFEHLCDLYNHQPTPDKWIDLEAKANELNKLFRASQRNN